MTAELDALIDDLLDETRDVEGLLAGRQDVADLPTPAEGWTVGNTVSHLLFFDREARRAAEEPDQFVAGLTEVIADSDAYLAKSTRLDSELGDQLLPSWQAERAAMAAAVRAVPAGTKIQWYGPPMSPMSFVTARLMETWAHGQDIADAVGIRRTPTDRLRHVCHLGVRTRAFSYAVRGRPAPDIPVFVSLTSPSGQTWEWGEPSAADSVTGPAEDFCLLVAQRRHLADLSLTVTGDAAAEWMSLAQAFAGEASLTDPARLGASAS